VRHEKAKRKRQKQRSGGKYLLEQGAAPPFEEVVEKILGRFRSLGDQIFAFSPFSQYYDDWLLGLTSVLSEFELNPAVSLDERFERARSQIIADIELKLAERHHEETVLKDAARKLAEQKNLLVQLDTEYVYAMQKIESQRHNEIKCLTRRILDFEEELEKTRQMKSSIFNPFARKDRAQKTDAVIRKLDATKGELESIAKTFESEQNRLCNEYEKKKHLVIEQVQCLEKKVEGWETDGSIEDRRVACEELVNVVKALLHRKISLE
jgi:myosin heavy subunit